MDKLQALLAALPEGARLSIKKVFNDPPEYRIGFTCNGYSYAPGAPSYYPLEEAAEKALAVFLALFPSDNEGGDHA